MSKILVSVLILSVFAIALYMLVSFMHEHDAATPSKMTIKTTDTKNERCPQLADDLGFAKGYIMFDTFYTEFDGSKLIRRISAYRYDTLIIRSK